MDLFSDIELIQTKAITSNRNNKSYRRQARKVNSDEKFQTALQEQWKILSQSSKFAINYQAFEKAYRIVYSRICTIDASEAKEWQGKESRRSKVKIVGPSLKRYADFLSKERPNKTDTSELEYFLNEMKVQTKIDGSFCRGLFSFESYVRDSDVLLLRDVTTYNFKNIFCNKVKGSGDFNTLPDLKISKKKIKSLSQDQVAILISTLKGEPWLRAGHNSLKTTWEMFRRNTMEWIGEQVGFTPDHSKQKLWLGSWEKSGYYKFQLSGQDDRTHTAATDAEAFIVAKALNREVIKLEYVEPYRSKSLEILDDSGAKLDFWAEDGCEW